MPTEDAIFDGPEAARVRPVSSLPDPSFARLWNMNQPNAALPYEIDVHAVKSLLDNQAPFLFVDCRDPDEFEFCRIEGTRLLPIKQVAEWLPALEAHKGEHIVVHCHAGRRSMRLTEMLRQAGFDRVQSMKGGINAWSNEIDSRIPIY